MINTSHLDSLNVRLSNERSRLSNAKTKQEKEIRKVWVSQLEKEIVNEKKFLGIVDVEIDEIINNMNDDDLLNELLG